jgi:DNA-binding protein H-NS
VIGLLAERVSAKQRELESEIARVQALNGGKSAPAAKPRAVVKYRGPAGEEWSGRGSKPKWVEDELAKGRMLEELKA